MKIFVFGALLLQTLNAQTDGTASSSVSLAPLITPGADTPAESDLLGPSTDASASSTVEIDTLDLPTGTADVVLDPTISPSPSDDAFGADAPTGTGVTFDDTSEFTFPTAVAVPADITSSSVSAASAIDTPLSIASVVPDDSASSAEPDFGDETTGTGDALGASPTPADPFDPDAAVDPLATSSDPFDFVNSSTTDPATAVAPDASDLPGDGSGLGEDPSQPEESPSSLDLGLLEPGVTPASSASAPTGLGAADDASDDSPYEGSPGADTTNYDGQYYGDDEKCPSYCLERGGDDTSYSRKLRRQTVPSSNGGFAAFQWGGDGMDTDECSNDVPDWLYESTGRQPVACKPKCPASCYASSPESGYPAPTKGAYKPYPTDEATTTDDYAPYGT